MRFVDYIKISSSDDDIAQFRSLTIKLVKESTGYRKMISNIDEVKEYKDDIDGLLLKLNKELKRIYNGNYRFDLCIDEGSNSDVLKIKKKYSKMLNMLCHSNNDKLSKIKKNIEINLSNNEDI